MTHPVRQAAAPADCVASSDSLAELVMECADRARETVSPRLSHLQLQALTLIDRHGALNLGALSELLFTATSSASRLCDRLEATGLIERHQRADNRREVLLAVAPDGGRLLDRVRRQRRTLIGEALGGQVLCAAPPVRVADAGRRPA